MTGAENGIIFLEKPLIVNELDFLYEHLDCDSIIEKNNNLEDNTSTVIAYAKSKEFNDRLEEIYYERGYSEKYLILQGIDSREVNSID